MDLNDMNVPGGPVGVLGAAATFITGALWAVRRVWRNDKVDGVESQAQIDIIARLSEQLDKANARAVIAEERADAAYRERNDAVREIGELKSTISSLTTEVRLLKERLDGKTTRSTS